ncbi:MAG: GTP cyclohydrolase I [Candidatus Dormibacteraeota bacterium]|nr:GTP cyclohydrolase I [Candidatus Dormibacteraeota bacterium]
MSNDGHGHEVGTLRGLGRRDSDDWQRSTPREIGPEQWARYEANMREIFQALGMEVDTPGTEKTPARFLKAMFDATEGYEGEPKLVTAFPTECRGGPDCNLSQVIEGPIPYYSLCEHHALPFYGKAFVGYIAHENIIGISKLTRLVRLFARRFSIQERMGVQITETLEGILDAHGVAVYLDGSHLCTQMRGVRETDSVTRTTFWRGHYAEDPTLRAEFLRICEMRPGRT